MDGIKLIVATHKKYKMPKDDIYLPIHVGAYGKDSIGYIRDDSGDNISKKNLNYCELTGLYWAWKNLDSQYLGLVHYRRHYTVKRIGNKWNRILTRCQLEKLLENNSIILPPKRNYFIETTYSQYAHAHHAIDLDVTRKIIKEKYPEYIVAFDNCMKSTKGHKFNMFIMKKEYINSYCEWLFDILFELENRLDISDYSQNDLRVFGFVSERLLDVWLITNKLKYKEISVMFMEKQNWFIKISKFLNRKFT
jgi:hypothetical protein